ncbi:hypothetical protein DOE78_11025 [Bacillus sp. Y1]|nr:DUF5412 family protein [Bacillus sp. Y1]AYA75928.1 hypothetical protein DOE78_11025 [Bacillus sp. Y1]
MKKNVIIISLLLLCLFAYGVYWLLFDINRINPGEFISQSTSPNSDYTIKAYVNNGGATTDYAVLGVLYFNEENRRPKNIYWNYHEEQAEIKWENENTVVINGHKLKIPNETYDFRKD